MEIQNNSYIFVLELVRPLGLFPKKKVIGLELIDYRLSIVPNKTFIDFLFSDLFWGTYAGLSLSALI